MRVLRGIELVGGLAAGVLGLVGLARAILRGGWAYESEEVAVGPAGAHQVARTEGVERFDAPFVAVLLLIVLPLLIAISVGAYAHARHGHDEGLLLAAFPTMLLTFGTLATGFSVGWFLIPAALSALLTLVAGAIVVLLDRSPGPAVEEA